MSLNNSSIASGSSTSARLGGAAAFLAALGFGVGLVLGVATAVLAALLVFVLAAAVFAASLDFVLATPVFAAALVELFLPPAAGLLLAAAAVVFLVAFAFAAVVEFVFVLVIAVAARFFVFGAAPFGERLEDVAADGRLAVRVAMYVMFLSCRQTTSGRGHFRSQERQRA